MSSWWRYEFELDNSATQQSCYLGYEDFGNMIVEMYSGTCQKPAMTASYTYNNYAANKDRYNTVFTRGTNPSLPTFRKITTNDCAATVPASSSTTGTQDLPLASGTRLDLSFACDAVVSIKVDSTYSSANGDCLKFAVYGNLGASYLTSALVLALGSLLVSSQL